MTAQAGPVAAETLTAARDVALAALAESTSAGGYAAARAALGQLTVDQLLDVAAVLAVTAARPGEILLTAPEWWVLAARLGVEP
ncbi:hypothetical protein [Micromonospora sp. IBHARD004]|uniref:hypothetical protein n=1 Tax=Micromonospora sp. IBHARD004 TaxID=3457764 RepID=UPI0040599F98